MTIILLNFWFRLDFCTCEDRGDVFGPFVFTKLTVFTKLWQKQIIVVWPYFLIFKMKKFTRGQQLIIGGYFFSTFFY